MFQNVFQQMKGSYPQKVNLIMNRYQYRFSGEQRAHYDYTPYCQKKRTDLAVKGLSEAQKQLKGICDKDFIEAYFPFTNSLILRGGYNEAVDYLNSITLGAAIWMLDQLSLQEKLEECYPYLPSVPEEPSPIRPVVPYVNHPVYDYSLILSMVQLIRQRNTFKPFAKAEFGSLLWEAKKPDRDEDSRKNRENFDAVIQLLSNDAIKQAVDRYEEDIWRFYRLSFQAIECVEKRIQELQTELAGLEAKTQEMPAPYLLNNVLAMPQKAGNLDMRQKMTCDEKHAGRTALLQHQLEQLEDITFTQVSLVNDREKTTRKLGGILSEVLAHGLIHFRVEDPFESSFALMYLMDTKSDLPWFYYGSISVAYTVCDQLPYNTPTEEYNPPVKLSGWNSALYEHKYKGYRWPDTDVEGDPVQREFAKNLSQLLYTSSLSLFPRVVPEISSLHTYLEDLGELPEREQAAYALLLYSLHANNLRTRSLHEFRMLKELEEMESSQTHSEEIRAELPDDNESLFAEIQRLREKNEHLLSILQGSLARKRDEKNQLDTLARTVERQKRELSDLREKVFFLSQETRQEPGEDPAVQYPFYTKKRVLSFGGHPSWLNEMKKKLPDVVFIPPDMQPNADLIRGAEEIWIQTNCISHSSYYKIMDILKASGKQVRYYIYAGANKCAEQLAKTNDHSG